MHLSNIIYNLWVLLPVSITAFNITLLNERPTTPYNLIIVIASQNYEYHARMADENKRTIQYEALLLNRRFPTIHLSHRDFPDCYVPTLKLLAKLWHAYAFMKNTWIFIIEENTSVNLKMLYGVLDRYNANEEFWMGNVVQMEEFCRVLSPYCKDSSEEGFSVDYSEGTNGIAITTKLLKRISTKSRELDLPESCFLTTWSTYRYKDLAYFIWYRGNKLGIAHEPAFCMKNSTDCATYPLEFKPCGPLVDIRHLYFAVSTCQKYHSTRVPVIKNTWARFVTNIQYFSDVKDDDVPTVQLHFSAYILDGFCEKSLATLRYVKKKVSELPEIQWVVLLDDDTSISVYRLRELLSCYNHRQSLAIGEVMFSPDNYNFLCGGSGRVLSRTLLEELDPDLCKCPRDVFAEDMNIGLCFTDMNCTMIHSTRFHTLRADLYHEFTQEQAITFHEQDSEQLLRSYSNLLSIDDFNHSSRFS